MPGKHSTVFSARRVGFIGGAATLLVVLVAWVAVRSVGPNENQAPIMVLPSPAKVPAAQVKPSFAPIPWGQPNPTATTVPADTPLDTVRAPGLTTPGTATPGTATPSATGKTSPPTSPATPKPTKTTKPPVTTPPTPAASFTGRYSTSASWDRGLVAWILVTNTGSTTRTWKVTLTYESRAEVRITSAWNAQLTKDGDTSYFTGGTLAPGASVNLGFEATKQARGRVQPKTCTVEGAACQLT